ncbi:MAG TPA: NGG1p interacting factor NIF3 [Spongiibacteraceae bacterium]|nr:NGG1p interacting factor NIF3 [Spongiibacteraceae bacterium]MBN50011.1 NGG1p interacting factor NIF3 [Spongiibacteraceae bacterium]HCS29120.1 NGG1p interacting factor NIF3 [Spongiibacteraceae bacterium]
MYKLIVFVPESHTEAVKTALFEAGAGRQGDYDSCAWQTPGVGQFRPLAGSKPYLGQTGEVERVQEYRVEMLCEDDVLDAAVKALRVAHPYEEPAFEVIALVQVDG